MRARLRALVAETPEAALGPTSRASPTATWRVRTRACATATRSRSSARGGRQRPRRSVARAARRSAQTLVAYHVGLAQALPRGRQDSGCAQGTFAQRRASSSRATCRSTTRYAQALIDTGEPEQAHTKLLDLLNNIDYTPEQVHLIAVAADAAGEKAEAHYYMAELHVMNGELPLAIHQLELALATPTSRPCSAPASRRAFRSSGNTCRTSARNAARSSAPKTPARRRQAASGPIFRDGTRRCAPARSAAIACRTRAGPRRTATPCRPGLQRRLLQRPTVREGQRPRMRSEVFITLRCSVASAALPTREEHDARHSGRHGAPQGPQGRLGDLLHARLHARILARDHHVRLEQHAFELHALRVQRANTCSACPSVTSSERSIVWSAVHEHFRLDDRNDVRFLARGPRSAPARAHWPRCTAVGMPSPMVITARHFAKRAPRP